MRSIDYSVFDIKSFEQFEESALRIYRVQYDHNIVYRNFSQGIKRNPNNVKHLTDIPFLPISFFKSHQVVTSGYTADDELIFMSSGTSSDNRSRHYVKSKKLYDTSIDLGFRYFFGNIEEYVILALLPHYLEIDHSSLIYMAKRWTEYSIPIEQSFFLNEYDLLSQRVERYVSEGKKVIVLGISFALLDWADRFSSDSSLLTIIETGGMKGKRKEIPKDALWDRLRKSFTHATISSEYGMCELLSQSYAKDSIEFMSPMWQKVLVNELSFPIDYKLSGTGQGCIIDLANQCSCSFIQTDDLVKLNLDGSFEIIGRKDNSDIRGCSLLID